MAKSTPKPPARRKKPLFVSWRWRIVLPLFFVTLVAASVGAYFLAARFSGGLQVAQDNILLESLRGMLNRSDALYQRQLQEAQRVAFTVGIPEAVELGQTDVWVESLEAISRAASLDSILLINTQGQEALGIQRVLLPNVDDFAVNRATDLTTEPIVQAALGGRSGDTGILRTPEGLVLFVSVPLRSNQQIVGAVLVGAHLERVASELQGSAVADVALYGASGELIQTTLPLSDDLRPQLALPSGLFQQVLGAGAGTIPVETQSFGGQTYRTAYSVFRYGATPLGVVALFLPDSLPFATEVGRQLAGVLAAVLAGSTLFVVFLGLGAFTGRLGRVQHTAEALASGEAGTRTGLRATDEAGAVGAALDRYADSVQREHSAMQGALLRQRRETAHMVAVLEAMPEGVIVQDMNGKVTLINAAARALMGANATAQSQEAFAALQQQIVQVLGVALAPGLYALGDPQQIALNNRMMSAQAAAITDLNAQRVGTVIVLKDITELVRQEQQREQLLRQVQEQVQSPLQDLAQTGAFLGAPIDRFAREITQRAVALQRLVLEMRELIDVDLRQLEQTQKPLRLDTLLWTVANDWRQIAQAADLRLLVTLEKQGLHVLGDEKRLRWAIGNIVDNAIKYTPAGGVVTLELTGEQNGQALMRVRDNGTGIAADELPKVTTRFYRGNPTLQDGSIIRTPGMGQGLYVAKHLIEAHGGLLKVRSKPQVGTAVYFALPLTSAVAMDLPLIMESFEGETVKLPEDYLPNLKL